MENDEIAEGKRQETAQSNKMFSKGGGGRGEGGGRRTDLNLFSLKGLAELTVSVDEAPSPSEALSHDGTCSSQRKTKQTT